MNNQKHGGWVIMIGVLLALAGCLWAYAPIKGLCPMNFRSVDAYHIRLVHPPLAVGSAWDRTWLWAFDESLARHQAVIVSLIVYNIAGLIFLRRQRGRKTAANQASEVTARKIAEPQH